MGKKTTSSKYSETTLENTEKLYTKKQQMKWTNSGLVQTTYQKKDLRRNRTSEQTNNTGKKVL